MSLKNKFFSVITLAFAIVGFTTFAPAQTTEQSTEGLQKQRKFERRAKGERGMHKGMKGGRHGGFAIRGLARLDLTDAQKTQIKGIFESQRVANQPFHQEMRSLIQKKRGGAELTEADKARFGEIRTQMKASAQQTHNSILSILTVEQRQQLEQMKQEMQKRREERKQFRQNRQRPTTDGTIN